VGVMLGYWEGGWVLGKEAGLLGGRLGYWKGGWLLGRRLDCWE
jgi:hypothetical protein